MPHFSKYYFGSILNDSYKDNLVHFQLSPQLGLALVLHRNVPGTLVQAEHVEEAAAAAKVPRKRPQRVGPVEEEDGVAGGEEVLRRAGPPGAGAEVVYEPDRVALERHRGPPGGDEDDLAAGGEGAAEGLDAAVRLLVAFGSLILLEEFLPGGHLCQEGGTGNELAFLLPYLIIFTSSYQLGQCTMRSCRMNALAHCDTGVILIYCHFELHNL